MASATPRQIALIEYLGGPAKELSKADASEWISAAMEDPKYEERRFDWNREKLQLHPELFAKEVTSWKSDRAEMLQMEMESFEDFFNRISKANAQIVINHLDELLPGWDAAWMAEASCPIFETLQPALEKIAPKSVKAKYRECGEPRYADDVEKYLQRTRRPTPENSPMITITRDGESYGPYDAAAIESMLTAGQLALSDHAWQEGETDWRPLGELIGRAAPVPPPLPQAVANGEQIIFQEAGITVTNQKIVIGGNTFVARNVGGVSIERIEPRRVFPTLGFLIFGMMLIGSFATFNSTGEAGQGAGVFMIIVFGGLTLVCGLRAFKRAQFTIALAAAGGMQKAFTSPDQKFVERVAAAIQQAIL